MSEAGFAPINVKPPLWVNAEITYRCPLHCLFCYNPVDYAHSGPELSTDEWVRTLRQARELGGAFFPIDKTASRDGLCRATLRCALHARLGAGPWSITLRLENRRSGQLAFPIDKQVGALVFDIEQPDRGAYLALVDLSLTCERVLRQPTSP